ncbi:MAG: hypothetical protein V1779_00740 [bacterium]
MKVTFDSNNWFKIAQPERFPKHTESLEKIKNAIEIGDIIPYISETIFTLEIIQRKDRKAFFETYKPNINIKDEMTDDGVIKISFEIGHGNKLSLTKNPILKELFEKSKNLGFRIGVLPRIAGLINYDIEEYKYLIEDLTRYQNEVFEVGKKIEDKGAGFSQIKAIGEAYDNNWVKGLALTPNSETERIADAVAEWADGDSVAVSIALGCDYFCTSDIAKKAGSASVLSSVNLKWLHNDYGFNVISPEDLARSL